MKLRDRYISVPAADERIAASQEQAAKALGVTTRTIRNWEKQGRLAGQRVGGVKLYPWKRLCELAGVTNG